MGVVMYGQSHPLIRLVGWILLLPFCMIAQKGNVSGTVRASDSMLRRSVEMPDWLSAGMMEVGQGGQLQAAARVVRLFIGEPGKWQLPLSLYSGVAQPGVGAMGSPGSLARSNESITWQLYSAWSGLINLGFEGQRRGLNWGAQSGLRFVFQFGERILSEYRMDAPSDSLTGKQQLLWNHYLLTGWVVHTGAWERSDPRNLGRGWVMFRGHLHYSSPDDLRWLFPISRLRGVYGGGSLAVGIEVSRVVHVRAVVCWPWLRPEWSVPRSLTQFSFQYNWKP